MYNFPRPRVFLVCVMVLGACSSPATPETGGDTGGILFDTSGGKLDGKGDTAKVEDSQSLTDSQVDPSGCQFPEDPQQGEPGATCKSGNDCASGFCVESANGKFCTRPCVDCCPTGMACTQISSGPDLALVCVPQMLALCSPCTTDAECALLDKTALCIDRGDTDAGNEGKFCGTGCADTADCLTGYECKTVQGEKGAGKQCIPVEQVCACSDAAILAGATTTCKVGNDFGLCSGTRKCGLDGLTLCSAPSPTEEACNGKDDNCDGETDEGGALGCTLWYGDGDDDGFGGGTGACLCAANAQYKHSTAADCDDGDASIHPGAAELCDAKDNNCEGKTDEAGAQGCLPYYADGDKDGAGGGTPACLCAADLAFPATSSSDCNDGAAEIFPGASEVCDGADNNCNGLTDESGGGGSGCTLFYKDGDEDGWGGGVGACLCAADNIFTLAKGGDCDDNNAGVHPKNDETCNGADDDCNGQTDEVGADGCKKWYADADGDQYGVGAAVCLCEADTAHSASVAGDCDDTKAGVNPKAAETCNGVDDDCNGDTDGEDAAECVNWYSDGDVDGYGAIGVAPQCLCKAKGAFTASVGGDCNDASGAAYPGGVESCDDLDNNCDGTTDPISSSGCQNWYLDADIDGYGSGDSQCACGKSGSYTTLLSGDCNDSILGVHPGATEIPCNSLDDDCDPGTSDGGGGGSTTYYKDFDGDGFGDPGDSQVACEAIAGYVTNKGDCNDYQIGVNPAAQEVACNGIDDNCFGGTDEGSPSTLYYLDGDADGYGTGAGVTYCTGSQPGGYVTQNGDCKDNAKAVNPGAAETCNTTDDNCDGQTDEGLAKTYYRDADGDGFGTPNDVKVACSKPSGYVTNDWDCNDTTKSVQPVIVPFFGFNISSLTDEGDCDYVDNDCDGKIDEGVTQTIYPDTDNDGYGALAGSKIGCPGTAAYSTDGSDCDDGNFERHPNAAETTCDAIDQDCIGGDACGTTCVAQTLYNFDTGPQGWTVPSGWIVKKSITSSQALIFGKWTGGFDKVTGGSTSSTNFNVPGGAVKLQFSVYHGNLSYVDSNDSSIKSYDTGATVTVSLNGVTATSGTSNTSGNKTITVPVDQATWNTQVALSVTVKTTDSSSESGAGFAIDNIQVLCQ